MNLLEVKLITFIPTLPTHTSLFIVLEALDERNNSFLASLKKSPPFDLRKIQAAKL